MSKHKSIFGVSGILRRARDSRKIRLPDASTGLQLELMHKHRLNNEFMGDLRVSGRNGGSGHRGR